MDGKYEPVQEVAEALDRYQARTGIDIPNHVDGANGAFIAPFIQPDLEWDFRVPRVVSINASGHKYGLVCPGPARHYGEIKSICQKIWYSM